ncbi:MAG: MFS transporter [Capsulimonadaceae bacterium]
MPFISIDPSLTGTNLRVTPTAAVTRAGEYTILIKGPQTRAQNPALKADQPASVYNLVIKPGDPSTATRASVKPVEKFVLNNADPATLAALNARSHLIRVALAPGAHGNPNENVIPLKPWISLPLREGAGVGKIRATGYQPISNGYPAALKLTLVGIPLLAAGFWRILLGVLADRFGSYRIGTASMLLTLLPLAIGWHYASGYNALVFMAFFLGLAGASFAVALPLASRWYPPHLQGLAMGIAGAGNSGTVLATVLAPLVARSIGWHGAFALLMIPVGLTLIVFATLAKDPPAAPRPSRAVDYAAVLAQPDAWWFCVLYFVTFGGFVGMSSFFNTFFVDQYDAPRATVGLWTWPFIIVGSFLRPVGGALADRLGGVRMLMVLYGVVTAASIGIGLCIAHYSVTWMLLMVLMGCLGMGNGSVFQLVPQRFRREIGVMTGLVGAAGGVGGYYLNFALGHLHDITRTYASGFYAFAGIAVIALIVLRAVTPAWTRSWLGAGGVAKESPEFRVAEPTYSGDRGAVPEWEAA